VRVLVDVERVVEQDPAIAQRARERGERGCGQRRDQQGTDEALPGPGLRERG